MTKAIAALAAAGLAISAYLTWVHYAGIEPVCTGISDCERVQTSSYAELVGIPKLKEEESLNYSLGFTWHPHQATEFTVDAYLGVTSTQPLDGVEGPQQVARLRARGDDVVVVAPLELARDALGEILTRFARSL